jgi:glycerol-3-phosphate dehydrogenase (NAD(P)+)
MKPDRAVAKIAVLGAGYMGSAITFPLAENGMDVRLWGTWLDDEIIQSCRAGVHPKLKKRLPESVALFSSSELEACLDSVDCVILAVTSEGFPAVFDKLLPLLSESMFLMTVTKGFVAWHGRVERVSAWALERSRHRFPDAGVRWASIGGPVKAVELASHVPTASVYGVRGPEGLPWSFSTDTYRVHLCRDVAGVELCSALKNIYALVLGICDGQSSGADGKRDNLKALLFSRAVEEMAAVVEAFGGRRDTVTGLAGVGDLYVTAQSGRNRRFGELVGRDMKPREAYQRMLDEGEVAEGYRTLELALRFLRQPKKLEIGSLPLLAALERIVIMENSAEREIRRYLKSSGS